MADEGVTNHHQSSMVVKSAIHIDIESEGKYIQASKRPTWTPRVLLPLEEHEHGVEQNRSADVEGDHPTHGEDRIDVANPIRWRGKPAPNHRGPQHQAPHVQDPIGTDGLTHLHTGT